MKPARQRRLRAAGFNPVTIQEFFRLSDEEMTLIDMKVRLVTLLKSARQSRGITQQKLARLMASSQSRVAKLEGACADASLDLICRALFAVGVTSREIGKTIAAKRAA